MGPAPAMSLIEWKDEFNLGIESVDTDHRALIELINAMHDNVLAEADPDDVAEGVTRIYDLVAVHFADEEAYMRESRYMAYAEHKEDHEILLDDLRDIIDQVRSDSGFAEARLSADLEYWFSQHFRTHDARLHRGGHPDT
jgi:hemerythrin